MRNETFSSFTQQMGEGYQTHAHSQLLWVPQKWQNIHTKCHYSAHKSTWPLLEDWSWTNRHSYRNSLHIKTLNCRPNNINATLHAGFLCLRLYFHEYANFIKNYSTPVFGGRGGKERRAPRVRLPAALQCAQRWDEVAEYLHKAKKKKGGNTGSAGD